MLPQRAVALLEEIKVKQRSLAQMMVGTATPPATPPWKRPKVAPPVGHQRIANASVTPPTAVWGWTCVPGNCQPAKGVPCGMMHPPSHKQCFRCGATAPHVQKADFKHVASPNRKLAPVVLPKAPVAAPVAEAMDVEPQQYSGEADINEPLDVICSRIIGKAVTCPDIGPVIALLADRPKDDNAEPLQDKIHDKEAELEAAQNDKQLSVNQSERFQKLAQLEVDNITNELHKLRSQCTLASSSNAYSTSSLAELDKKRATAIASKESWQSRSLKKSSDITEKVNDILQEITNAEDALEMQRQHINDLQQTHTDTWNARQDLILRSHDAKIAELQELCQSKGQLTVETNVTTLQAQVQQLLEQVQAQQALMSAAEITHQGAIEQLRLLANPSTPQTTSDAACIAVESTSQSPTNEATEAIVNASIDANLPVAVMGVAEREARIAHAANVADKGKGKGSTQDPF